MQAPCWACRRLIPAVELADKVLIDATIGACKHMCTLSKQLGLTLSRTQVR